MYGESCLLFKFTHCICNQAVVHAPGEGSGEGEMALSLGNRSAALFHLQHFKVTALDYFVLDVCFGGLLWWSTLVVLFGGLLWWSILVVYFGGLFWWSTLVVYFGGLLVYLDKELCIKLFWIN